MHEFIVKCLHQLLLINLIPALIGTISLTIIVHITEPVFVVIVVHVPPVTVMVGVDVD